MVAAVAMDEPQMAPKPAQAMTLAMARPPRKCPTKVKAKRYNSLDMPARVTKLPIRMNKGTTDKVY